MTICSKCGRNSEEVCICAEIDKSVQRVTTIKPQTVDEFNLRGATTRRWTSITQEEEKMNRYIFCVIVEGQIQYGQLRATGYEPAHNILKERYQGRLIQKIELKAVTNNQFEFDVVGDIVV